MQRGSPEKFKEGIRMYGYVNVAFCLLMVLLAIMAFLLTLKKTRNLPWVKKLFPFPYLVLVAVTGLIAVYHDNIGIPLRLEVGTRYQHVQGEKGRIVWLKRVYSGEVRVFILPENFLIPPDGQVFQVKEEKKLKPNAQEVKP